MKFLSIKPLIARNIVHILIVIFVLLCMALGISIVWQHKARVIPGFTAKYGVDRLVWFETHESLETALLRERRIKKWKRDWKINLIERENPHWADLYPSLLP